MNELTPELRARIRFDVENALDEDVGSGDITAALVPDTQQAIARVIARETAVICGQPWFNEVFRQLDPAIVIDWAVSEGAAAKPDSLVCEVRGPAQAVLTGERSALNFLQTLSATATAAQAYAHAVAGTAVTILDTRKTLPGLRLAQKYAVKTGGAANHRIGLYDGILIKENHIAAAGGIGAAVTRALEISNGVLVEAEVETITEAKAAMEAGAHRLLLDNFTTADMATVVLMRNEAYPRVTLEASGNVNFTTVAAIAATGIDFISIGALTKDVRAIDFSMRFDFGSD